MDLRGFNRPLLGTSDSREELVKRLQEKQPNKPKVSGAARFAVELLPGGSLLTKRINDENISGGDVALEALLSLPGGKAVKGAFKGAKAARQALKKSDLEGYLARSAKRPATMSGVEQVASERRIPVTFLDDASVQSGGPAVPIAARGIPIKSVDSTSVGTGVPNTANKVLLNPKVSDIESASADLMQGGYSVSSRIGAIKGRKSYAGSGSSVYEPSIPQSYVQVRGKKTDVPILEQMNGTSTIAAKQQPITGYSAPVSSGRGYTKSQQVLPKAPAYTGSVDSLPSQASSQPAGIRQRLANAMTARGSGLKVGENVGDVNRLDEAAELYQRYGIAGTPTKQLRKIESTMDDLGTQVDDILARNPVPMSGDAVRATVQKAVDDPLRYAELDLSLPGVKRNLDMHLTKFGQATSAKDVNDYIKTLNPIAKRAQDKLNRGVALTDKEAAALAAKKAGDEALSAIPEIKPYKKDMAILFDRNVQTSKEVGKGSNIPVVGGVLKAPNSLMRSAQSKAGVKLAGGAPQGLLTRRQATQRYLMKQQAPIQGAQSLLSSPPNEQETQSLLQQINSGPESTEQAFQAGGDATDYLLGQEKSGPSIESLQQALIEDQQLTGGKNNEFLMQLAELNGIRPGGQNLSADQRKGVAATTNAENVINEIEQAFANVGGGQGAFQGQARNLLGKVRLDQNARYYNDVRQAFLSRIARAFGEVGTLNEGDIQRAINAIPDIADTPSNAQNKIAVLRSLLGKAKKGALSGNYGTYGGETSQSGNLLTQMNGL